MGTLTQKRVDYKSVMVSMACWLGASYCGYLFYQDLHSHGSRTGTPMARLERFQSKVKTRPSSSFVWNQVDSDEDLYIKDSVQTGSASGASIKFKDGTLLEVGENSLVVIDSLENLALNFKTGSIVVRGKTGDSRITVGKDGKAKVEELPVRMIKPDSLANFYVPEKSLRPVQFEWEVLKPTDDKLKVQISSDRGFKNARTQTLDGTSGPDSGWSISAKLAPGRYFWRVIAADKPGTEAEQFTIEAATALKPIYPNQGQKIPVWGDRGPIQFRWVAPAEDSHEARLENEIELASDADFKNMIASEKIAALSGVATLKDIPPGQMFWRIRSHYPDMAVTSATERFTIDKEKNIAIELGKPEQKASFEKQPELRFNWMSEASNVDFEIQVQSTGNKELLKNSSRQKVFTWKQYPAGTYRWHVAAHYADQLVGESPWREFSVFEGAPIALKAPLKNQEIFYWKDPTRFDFKWGEDALAEKTDHSYLFEVSQDNEFTRSVVSKKIKDTEVPSKTLNLAAGTYFWRVRVVDSSGQIVKSSEIDKFSYGNFPVLRAPASMKPEPGMQFNPLEEKFPQLSWSSVDNAQNYEVSVQAPDGKVVRKQTTSKTVIEFKDLPEGKYSYTVSAIDELGRKGAPTPGRNFDVTLGAPLGAPESTSPEVQ